MRAVRKHLPANKKGRYDPKDTHNIALFYAILAPFRNFFLYLQSLSGVYRPLPLGATADADGDGGRKRMLPAHRKPIRGITGKGPVW